MVSLFCVAADTKLSQVSLETRPRCSLVAVDER